MILVSLAASADLLSVLFDKRDLKKRKQRIKKLTYGEFLGKASREAVEAANAANWVAVRVDLGY